MFCQISRLDSFGEASVDLHLGLQAFHAKTAKTRRAADNSGLLKVRRSGVSRCLTVIEDSTAGTTEGSVCSEAPVWWFAL